MTFPGCTPSSRVGFRGRWRRSSTTPCSTVPPRAATSTFCRGDCAGSPATRTRASSPDQAVATGGGMLNGWAVAPQGRGLLLGSVDNQGRPLFINSIQNDGSVPNLLGRRCTCRRRFTVRTLMAPARAPTRSTGSLATGRLRCTAPSRVSRSASATRPPSTTVRTQLNLWQRNMFAVRAEIEVGFIVRDGAHFVKLTSATQS